MANPNLPELRQEAVLNMAKKFDIDGTAHVNLMQCLLKKPLLTKKMFYVQYLAQYIEIDLKQPTEVFRNFPIGDNACEELTRNLIKALNSEVTEEQRDLREDEKYLLNTYINKIMTTEDTEVDRFWLIEQARNLPNTMNATKTEGFLDRLCGDNWLEENDGIYTMGVRGVAELGTVLKRKYDLSSCSVCEAVIVRGKLAKECIFCKEKMHKPCWKRLLGNADEQTMSCPGKNCVVDPHIKKARARKRNVIEEDDE